MGEVFAADGPEAGIYVICGVVIYLCVHDNFSIRQDACRDFTRLDTSAQLGFGEAELFGGGGEGEKLGKSHETNKLNSNTLGNA